MTIMPHNPFNWLFGKRPAKAKPANKNSDPKAKNIDHPLAETSDNEKPCCSGKVHIAYRGVSDDRLYLSPDRKWPEIKYFRPKGLRAFCADCRRRVY